jgi:hypothetical protein
MQARRAFRREREEMGRCRQMALTRLTLAPPAEMWTTTAERKR